MQPWLNIFEGNQPVQPKRSYVPADHLSVIV